jgi:hypothetical protein
MMQRFSYIVKAYKANNDPETKRFMPWMLAHVGTPARRVLRDDGKTPGHRPWKIGELAEHNNAKLALPKLNPKKFRGSRRRNILLKEI